MFHLRPTGQGAVKIITGLVEQALQLAYPGHFLPVSLILPVN